MKFHKMSARTLGICAVLLLSVCGLTYAAYTNQGYRKGVVSTELGAVRFSSNVLVASFEGNELTSKTQLVPFDSAETSEFSSFSVYNYPLGNQMQPNSASIAYDLKFEIIGASDADKPAIQVGSGEYAIMTGLTEIISRTLTGGAASSDSYSIRFPGASIGEYQLRVTAAPSDAASKRAAQNQVLSCLYVPVLSSASQSTEFSATGEFTDLQSGHTPDEYHAFNYRVSLQNYTGTVRLSWASQLQPDPFFLESLGIAENNDSLELTVTEETANYEFVFYRTDVAFTDPESWLELESSVTFTATSNQ